MTLWGMLFLGIALAMDCFTVSVTCGILQKRMGRQALAMAFMFGMFQAMMPMLGWLAAALFSRQIMAYDHWVAFGLLFLLGAKMIWEGFHPDRREHCFNPSKPAVLLTLAVATSIDALAVGIAIAVVSLPPVKLYGCFAMIFTATLLSSLAGVFSGRWLGKRFGDMAQVAGGAVLVIIGAKILVEHTILA